jgi:hypothetical protein
MKWAVITCLGLLLLGAGAVIHVRRAVEETPPMSPLVQAVLDGDVPKIEVLLASGVDPNGPYGGRGRTPLVHAIHTNRRDVVAALIDGGADVNRAMGAGMTPLMLATAYGYNDVVELLLTRGADPYTRTSGGLSALDFAMLGAPDVIHFTAFRCQPETVAIIRKKAPDLKPRSGRFDQALLFLKSCRY